MDWEEAEWEYLEPCTLRGAFFSFLVTGLAASMHSLFPERYALYDIIFGLFGGGAFLFFSYRFLRWIINERARQKRKR
jgi:hypothetical protein